MLRQTIKLMKKLRESSRFRSIQYGKNQKIDEWIDFYLEKSRLENKPITVITPWSLSKGFEKRYKEQENNFFATRDEIELFSEDIPRIKSYFDENGFLIEWWIIFSRSYIDSRVIDIQLENAYVHMINKISEVYNSPVVFTNWEDEIIQKRHSPNPNLLLDKCFDELISKESFAFELERWKQWALDQTDLSINHNELIRQTKYQIACEAEEGRYLMEEKNPICDPGQFLFLPLGSPERYTYFSAIAKDFSKRTAFVLRRYPWRSYISEKEKNRLVQNQKRMTNVDQEAIRSDQGFTHLWFK